MSDIDAIKIKAEKYEKLRLQRIECNKRYFEKNREKVMEWKKNYQRERYNNDPEFRRKLQENRREKRALKKVKGTTL